MACMSGMLVGLLGCVHVVSVAPYGRPANKRSQWASADKGPGDNLQLGTASRVSNGQIIRAHCFVVKAGGINEGERRDL